MLIVMVVAYKNLLNYLLMKNNTFEIKLTSIERRKEGLEKQWLGIRWWRCNTEPPEPHSAASLPTGVRSDAASLRLNSWQSDRCIIRR